MFFGILVEDLVFSASESTELWRYINQNISISDVIYGEVKEKQEIVVISVIMPLQFKILISIFYWCKNF